MSSKSFRVPVTNYAVELRFGRWVCGGLPSDPASLRNMMEAKGHGEGSPDDLREEVAAEVPPPSEDAPAGIVELVFKRDGKGRLFVEGNTVKAHLKDSARVLAPTIKKELGLANFRSKFADRVHVVDEHILLQKNGVPVTEPDGKWDHAIHVLTRQGPRSAIKSNEYLDGAHMVFEIRVSPDDGIVTEELLRACFEYGSVHGYGPERGLERGWYEYELSRMEVEGG